MTDFIDAKKFTPDGDRVLILPDPAIEKTESGIELPNSGKERPQVGTIIRIGPEVKGYAEGDRVAYGKTSGIRMDFNDEIGNSGYMGHTLMHRPEILGKI